MNLNEIIEGLESLLKDKRKRAVVREYFYEDEDEFWKVTGECQIVEQTNQSIKVKMNWWNRSKWYSKKAMSIRFEEIK